MGRRPLFDAPNDVQNVFDRDFGDRPLIPHGHEFLAHVALNVPALPLAGELFLDEIFEDGRNRILAPSCRSKLFFTLLLGRVDAAGDQLEPLPALLSGLLTWSSYFSPSGTSRSMIGQSGSLRSN
jgi:hypothetical protein